MKNPKNISVPPQIYLLSSLVIFIDLIFSLFPNIQSYQEEKGFFGNLDLLSLGLSLFLIFFIKRTFKSFSYKKSKHHLYTDYEKFYKKYYRRNDKAPFKLRKGWWERGGMLAFLLTFFNIFFITKYQFDFFR